MSRVPNPSKSNSMPFSIRRNTEGSRTQNLPNSHRNRSATFNFISLSRGTKSNRQSQSEERQSNPIPNHNADEIEIEESITDPVEHRESRHDDVLMEEHQHRGSSFLHTNNFYKSLINKDGIEESLIMAEKQAKKLSPRATSSTRSSGESIAHLKREMTRIEVIIDRVLRSQITLAILAILIAIDTLVVTAEISLEYYVIKTEKPDPYHSIGLISVDGPHGHAVKEVLHILHYIGISLMSVFAMEALLRILIQRGEFLREKLEVIDAIVVSISLITEVVILVEDWESEIVSTLVLLLLRITRVVLGILKNVNQKAEMRIYFLKKSRDSAKAKLRLMEDECQHLLQHLSRLEKLAREYHAQEEEITKCRPEKNTGSAV